MRGNGFRAQATQRTLVLESFHVAHPDPPSLAPVLAALDADVEVKHATDAARVARLNGPNGSEELR